MRPAVSARPSRENNNVFRRQETETHFKEITMETGTSRDNHSKKKKKKPMGKGLGNPKGG